jgi:hypothetical protein
VREFMWHNDVMLCSFLEPVHNRASEQCVVYDVQKMSRTNISALEHGDGIGLKSNMYICAIFGKNILFFRCLFWENSP